MHDPGDTADEAVDDVEQFLDPDDARPAGQDMASDNDPGGRLSDGAGDDATDDDGLPPEGDDPMDGVAPSS